MQAYFLSLFILSTILRVSLGASCPVGDSGYASAACPRDQPFCRPVTTNPTTYGCVECSSDCDCPIGKFCSSNIVNSTNGKCIDFKAEGRPCLDLSTTQLSRINVPADWKCADVVNTSATALFWERPSAAACVEGVCRFCNPYYGSSICVTGKQSAQTCEYPGKPVSLYKFSWRSVNYSQDPVNVWMAVFFPFIVIILVVQCLILCKNRLPGKSKYSSMK